MVDWASVFLRPIQERVITIPGLVRQVPRKVKKEKVAQSNFLRDMFGNPFHQMIAETNGLTTTVVALALGIYADIAFDRLPIMADALQDAGCEDEVVLNHCRQAGEHVLGCWALGLLLNKE
jgi:hypothetical protein